MAAPCQHDLQLLEIINLTVEDDPNRAVLVAERLVTTRQIDDGEPAMSQADRRTGLSMALPAGHVPAGAGREPLTGRLPVEEEPLFVGPTVDQGIGHPLEDAWLYIPAIPVHNSS